MGFNIPVYGASKKYTNQVALGLSNVSIDNTTGTVTFTLNDGSTASWTFPKPADGVSIVDLIDNGDGTFKAKLSDNTFTSSVTIPQAEVEISAESGNAITKKADGLYATGGSLLQPLTATQAIGSVTTGKTYTQGTSFEAIIRDMLIKEVAPSITLTLNPSTALYDVVSDTLSTIVLTATVTKQTYPPTKVTYYVDDVSVNEKSITDGGTFSYTYNFDSATNSNHTFKVVVTDGKLSNNASKTIKFVGQTYYGIVDSTIGTPTEAQIKGLSKTLKDVKGYTWDGITTDFGKVVYSYPQSMGALTSIKDPVNNFTYTDSFTRTTTSVDGIDYYVYTQTVASASDGVKLVFA